MVTEESGFESSSDGSNWAGWRWALSSMSGALLGAVAMYLLDQKSGRRRRALVRDKAVHLEKKAQHLFGKKARHVKNRVHGLIAERRHGHRSALRPDSDWAA